MKKIILTGGGTAGHVTPDLALLPSLKEAGYETRYIGLYQGMERRLIENAGIHCDGIPPSKLRRYFDTKNFSDPFHIAKGYAEIRRFLKCHKLDVISSRGGFVTVPVVLAAKHYKIPVIIYESDMTPGLANKICIPSALEVCCNFPEAFKYLPSDKAVLTGSPIRGELLQGDQLSGLIYVHPIASKPTPPVTGGSLGSIVVNTAVRNIFPRFFPSYQVMHICGKSNLDGSLIGIAGYVRYEYADVSLKHLFAAADLVTPGAGTSSICEFLALREPNLLTLLSAAASREDQILNANPFAKQGFSKALEEEALPDDSPFDATSDLYLDRNSYIQSMEQGNLNNAAKTVVFLIESCVK